MFFRHSKFRGLAFKKKVNYQTKLSFQVCLLVKLIENKGEDIKGNIYPSFETTLVDIHLVAGNSLSSQPSCSLNRIVAI